MNLKSKQSIAVCNQPQWYRNSHATWNHTVLSSTHHRWHSRLYHSQLKLVLDLATTPSALTGYITEMVLYPSKDGQCPQH